VKFKYGRKPVRFDRLSVPRAYVLALHFAALGPPPAISPDWVSAVMKQSPAGWLMDGNDNYGCCVIADCAHQEMLRTANVGKMWTPSEAEVLVLYARFQGYTGDLSDSAAIQSFLQDNDNGCDELSVIRYLEETGWAGRKLASAANLDPTKLDQIKWAVSVFGACRLGINIPDSAMGQFEKGEPWAPTAYAQMDGGHDVPIVKYDTSLFYVVTWGKLQPVTPEFMTAAFADGTPYVEEAHAELAFDWVDDVGSCPAKLDLAQLQRDLKAIIA